MKKSLKSFVAATLVSIAGLANALPVSGQGTWETTLQARDIDSDGVADAYYDTMLNITWLANGNGTETVASWSDANAWANSLIVGDVSDWRLPSTTDVGSDGCSYQQGGGGADCGFLPQSNSSELAHMYYVTLGNLGAPNDQGSPDTSEWGLHNTANFLDLRQNVYWSSTDYSQESGVAWGFSNYFGFQAPYDQAYGARAWAVHDGDVIAVAAPVPEPGTYALMFAGLAAVGVVRRKRQ